MRVSNKWEAPRKGCSLFPLYEGCFWTSLGTSFKLQLSSSLSTPVLKGREGFSCKYCVYSITFLAPLRVVSLLTKISQSRSKARKVKKNLERTFQCFLNSVKIKPKSTEWTATKQWPKYTQIAFRIIILFKWKKLFVYKIS